MCCLFAEALLDAGHPGAELSGQDRHAEAHALLEPHYAAIDGGADLGAMRRARDLLVHARNGA